MPSGFQGSELYRTRDQILAAFIAAWQASVPDVWVNEDGTLYIMLQIESAQMESLYLANQLVLEDMFIQTASTAGLQRHGEELGLSRLAGTPSLGSLLFSGEGGVFVPSGTTVGSDPGGGLDILYFQTTQDASLPNPGIPNAPTVAAGAAGNLTGTYEWAVTFLTQSGESLIGATSAALILSAQQANLTNLPLGGPGTIGRNVYRALNGGVFQLINHIADNTVTAWTDNVAAPTPTNPPTVDTSVQVLIPAQSEDTGANYNAVAGAITLLADVPPGLTAVTNPNPFSGGADVEDIEHYRQRLLSWYRDPQTGSPSDLESWAETIIGVDSATAFTNTDINGNPASGTVTVRIAGPGGTIPDSTVVDAVQALLNTYDLANVTIVVTTFTPSPINVSVTITPQSGYTVGQLTPSVQQAIENYINAIPAGGTFYVTALISAVVAVTGVQDVVVTAPTGNSSVAAQDKFTSGTITVS